MAKIYRRAKSSAIANWLFKNLRIQDNIKLFFFLVLHTQLNLLPSSKIVLSNCYLNIVISF